VFAIGALAFWWADRRISFEVRHKRWIKFATYIVIVHAFLLATVLGKGYLLALLALIVLVGFWEMFCAAARLRPLVAAGTLILFALITAGAIGLATEVASSLICYLYIVVAVFDGFSQAGGQLAGRTRLAPSISPAKTVEGFLIGAASSVSCAVMLRSMASLSPAHAAAVGAIASVAGVGGDLAASWVKRLAGLKDFGALLPGHGGVLDRFDSFLMVAAVMSVVIRW
jgi:phosphatidate cytidylyltransferase